MQYTMVTPEMARELLNTADADREIKLLTALQYAEIMRHGSWNPDYSSTPIEMTDGRLTNGQHRLLAVLLVDKPVELHLTWAWSDVLSLPHVPDESDSSSL